MFIDGIGLSGYRSFGGDLQGIGPFKKINLFIGQNNSGKSNILLFLTHQYLQALQAVRNTGARLDFQHVDRHLGKDSGEVVLALPLILGSDKYNALLEQCESQQMGVSTRVERLLRSEALTQGTSIAWFQYEASWAGGLALSPSRAMLSDLKSEQALSNYDWQFLWGKLTRQGHGTLDKHWIPETLDWFRSHIGFEEPQVSLIPAIRRVGEAGTEQADDYCNASDGIGISPETN